jgi:hypothetical protein
LLIFNFNELDKKDQKRKRKKGTTTIDVVTFFAIEPPKNAVAITVAFFCSKAIEEGDRSCRHLLLLFKHKEEGNDNKLSSLSSCTTMT